MVVHFDSSLLYNGLCLDMEVAEHGIAVPAPEEFNDIKVNVAAD